jgi:hypothetical protein
MVEGIIRVTVLAVFAVAAVNVLQLALLSVRLARHIRRIGRGDIALWFPMFRSASDVGAWLGRWRSIVMSGEPAMVAIRRDGRRVAGRYLHLVLMSNAWGMAVTAIAPVLS